LFLSLRVCFRKGVDSTTMHLSILFPEYPARTSTFLDGY
jgi:hypothetical protein